ncbi:hypothetical protein IL306_003617 [Fusarium sp. DS 682]|nr:hypothetical protein IL306_003617 [Fusarium sp. DS 682]
MIPGVAALIPRYLPPEKEESERYVRDREYGEDEGYGYAEDSHQFNWFNDPEKANERIVIFATTASLLFVIILILVWRIRKNKKAVAVANVAPDDDECY